MLLKDLPADIRELVIGRRMEASANWNADHESRLNDNSHEGGFDWNDSEEGFAFWERISHGDFSVYYEKYGDEKAWGNFKFVEGDDKFVAEFTPVSFTTREPNEPSDTERYWGYHKVVDSIDELVPKDFTGKVVGNILGGKTLAEWLDSSPPPTTVGEVIREKVDELKVEYIDPTGYLQTERPAHITDSCGHWPDTFSYNDIVGVEELLGDYTTKLVEEVGQWDTSKKNTDVPDFMKEESSKHKGLRFDTGKLRYDLENTFAREQMIRVLTKGANKYADRNWEQGMPWSKVIAPLKRHLAALEKGIDYDIDPNCPHCQASTKENWTCTVHTGELHAALIACNAHFLTAFYKLYPQGDDRPHTYLNQPKIGLDIDEVLCDWIGAWASYTSVDVPSSWYFDRQLTEKFEQLKAEGKLDGFYMGLEPLIKPEDIPFEPTCYITSRPVDTAITEAWLANHGFPAKPVFTVQKGQTKLDIALEQGLDLFVDDNFDTFVQMNKGGVTCFLMNAKHNERYQVGYRRLYHLRDLI